MIRNNKMIPKKIHYCWFGGQEMPPLNKACFDTWNKFLPDYELVRWDEENCPMNDFTQYHLEQGNWAFVADYVRLYALYTEGGIYLDTDVEVVQSFDDILDHSGFVAYEDENRINNAVCGGIKEHEFFKDCMEYMMERFRQNLHYAISPEVTTHILTNKQYDIHVYEKEKFYPYNPYDKSRAIKVLMFNMINENVYAIHHWAHSWTLEPKKKETKKEKYIRRIKRILPIVK